MMMYAGAVLLAVAAAIWLYLRGGGGRSKKGEHSDLENAGEEGGVGEVEELGKGFDYIIVGAGSSGCALASKLVRGGKSVLVLVDGSSTSSSDRLVSVMRSWWLASTSKSSVVSTFETQPQKGLGGRRLPLWVGRGGGGTGNLCATLWLRGRKEDYEENWPWDFSRIDASFKSVEDAMGLETVLPAGSGEASVEMMRQAGIRDVTAPGGVATLYVQEGLDTAVRCSKRGASRISPWTAFIQPILGNTRLKIRDRCAVRRLVIEQGRVTGIEVRIGGDKRTRVVQLGPKAEVILCAGALISPKILLLSGIGPEAHLASLAIPVQANNPGVGTGLQDHLLLVTANLCRKKLDASDTNGLGFHGFAHVEGRRLRGVQLLIKDTWDVPDMAPEVLTAPLSGGWIGRNILRPVLKTVIKGVMFLPPVKNLVRQSVGIGLALTDPYSRGTIRLASTDPDDAPLIDPGYLSDERDLQVLEEHFDVLHTVRETKKAQEWVGMELQPGPIYRFARTGAALRAWARACGMPYFHAAGSCRMPLRGAGGAAGQVEASGGGVPSAVDARLRVYGISGLRVADASVAPHVPTCPIQAMATMVGDYCGGMLLEENPPSISELPAMSPASSLRLEASSRAGMSPKRTVANTPSSDKPPPLDSSSKKHAH